MCRGRKESSEGTMLAVQAGEPEFPSLEPWEAERRGFQGSPPVPQPSQLLRSGFGERPCLKTWSREQLRRPPMVTSDLCMPKDMCAHIHACVCLHTSTHTYSHTQIHFKHRKETARGKKISQGSTGGERRE